MTGQQICECRFCGRDNLTPQGHKSHETYCDENPNKGIPYDKQEELGVLEGTGSSESKEAPPDHPNPDQSVSDSATLPSVETLSPSKKQGEPATDGGEPDECPLCGADVLDAGEAKAEYTSQVEKPNPKAVLAYKLADWTCTARDCGAVWGDDKEPVTMEKVVNA